MEPQPMRSMRKIEDSLVNCVGIYNLRSGIGPRWHLRGPTANLHSAQFSRENIKRQTMFQSERNGVAHQVRRNTIMATLQQRSKSVGENELPLMPKPKSNRLPSLQFLASSSIITVIETGFIGIKSAGGPPKDPKEVRARLFNYDARRVLKSLETEPAVARRLLLEMAPSSTAIYCAIVSMAKFDTYGNSLSSPSGSLFNRSLDIEKASFVNPMWQNLRRLNMRGTRVDSEFLVSLSSGPARSTLQSLDLSATLVTDADIEPVALFEDLRELDLNQCPYLTRRTLERVCCFGEKLEKLGLNSSEINLPTILDLVAGVPESDPLPKLKELHMESEFWYRHTKELQNFLQRRKNLSQLRVWAVVPRLDFSTENKDYLESELVKTLVKMCPVQRLYLSESALETTKMTPHLRDLQLQISNCDQDHVDSIAQNCPLLRSLTISSARFSDGRGVSFSKLESLQEMRLIDAALGKIAEFPRRLEKLSVTISSIDCEARAVQLVNAICELIDLKKLNLITAQGDLGGHYFPIPSFSLMLVTLVNLEELVVDRHLFAGSRVALINSLHVPIKHKRLKVLKLLSSPDQSLVPYVHDAPNLMCLECTNKEQSVASLASITSNSPNMRSLRLCFDAYGQTHAADSARASSTPNPAARPAPLHKRSTNLNEDYLRTKSSLPRLNLSVKQVPSPKKSRAVDSKQLHDAAQTAQTNFQLVDAGHGILQMRFLTEISIDGAAESFAARLPRFRHLHRIRFAKCQLSEAFLMKLAVELKSLRDLELERCSSFNSVECMRGSLVARLTIRSCPEFSGPISISGADFPNLEVINLAQLYSVTMLSLYDLPQLRWVTLSNIESPNVVNISDVPRLYDLAFDNVCSTQIRVHSTSLRRLYLDFGPSAASPPISPTLGSGGEDLSPLARQSNAIVLNVPNLEKLSWQGEEIPIAIPVTVVSKTPKLNYFEMPSTLMEDFEEYAKRVRETCPDLPFISCGDGEISLRT